MYQLGIGAACTFVRTALDELMSVEETGQLIEVDALDLHRLVENLIVEAVVTTHSGASHLLIDGISGAEGVDYKSEMVGDVITVTMLKDTLRLSSIQAGDSDVVVSEPVPEDSAEGRKQLDIYAKGVYDDPRVVLAKRWAGEYRPVLRYYSAKNKSVKPDITLEYVPYPVITESVVEVCPRLEHAVLNELAALVLNSLNEHEKAALYRAKAQAMMGG